MTGNEGFYSVNASCKAGRRASIPAILLAFTGLLMVCSYVMAKLLCRIEGLGPHLLGALPWVDSILLLVSGSVLFLLGIVYEVWDAHRVWRRPLWRIRRELEASLRALNLTTASTIDSLAAPLDGLQINHYRWDSDSYCATIRLAHHGNARITLDSLQEVAQANPFRYSHSVEVERFYNRRRKPDGYLIRIFYRNESETVDRQLEKGKPWMTK